MREIGVSRTGLLSEMIAVGHAANPLGKNRIAVHEG